MTESFGPGVHPDLDRLADVDAGVETDHSVESHVAACPDCQRALGALRATSADIAALPQPIMPADVARRIDAALDRESATPRQGGTVVPIESAGKAKRRSGLLAGGVAAAVIVALVVALTLNALGHNSGSNKTTNTTAGGAAALSAPSVVVHTSGTNYTVGRLQGQISTLLTSPTTLDSSTAGTSGSGAGIGAGPQAGSTPAGAAPTLAPSRHQGPNAAGAPALPSQLSVLQRDPAALGQCISTLLQGEAARAPLAVDLAQFDRAAAAIFVFPGKDPAHLHVYVVPPGGCTSGIFAFYNITR